MGSQRALPSLAWRLTLVGMLLAGCARPQLPPPEDMLTLTTTDRVLILAPHPDDDVLGCAGIIQHAITHDIPVRIVYVTYGDSNEWSFLVYRKRPAVTPQAVRRMGEIRRREAVQAMAVLGVAPAQLTFLGYPDARMLRIWEMHWGQAAPARGILTRSTAVPYTTAWRPGAAYTGENVVQDLTAILREFRPTKVFVSHPADHNPDHRALYLFARVALWDLADELQVAVYPYLIHTARWPLPRGLLMQQPLDPPTVLAGEVRWHVWPLTPEERANKYQALEQHRTQMSYSRAYLQAFMRRNELFGDFAPVILTRDTASGIDLVDPHAATVSAPDELTEEEQHLFIGIVAHRVRQISDRLELTLRFSRPLAKGARASFALCGYRHDQPFANMPKVRIQFSATGYTLTDRGRRLRPDRVSVLRAPHQVRVTLPLALLGDPQRILTSSRTRVGTLPLHWTAWRELAVAQ